MARTLNPIQNHSNNIKTTTIREFDGGWNVIDNDLNLSSRYSKRMMNVLRSPDGSIALRYGTKLFASANTEFGSNNKIVNITYFNDSLICVSTSGEIVRIQGDGTVTKIWSSELAATLSGSPSGWSTTSFVSFAQFKGDLIVCNGIDKPLIISSSFVVDYLQDLATLTNINTPISRYVVTHKRYVVMLIGSTLFISNVDTSGTWPDDPAPNDSLTFDLGGYLPSEADSTGIGLGAYRDKLAVMFRNATVIVTLGNYDSGGAHVPTVDDVIEQQGSISHRTIQALGDDMLYADMSGVASIERALFTGSIKPDRPSQLIDPEIRNELFDLSFNTMEDRCFSLYNRREGQYMFFVPNADLVSGTFRTRGFVYTLIRGLKVKAWSEILGWNWTCGCRSALGRMFFVRGNDVFIYGDSADPFWADFIGDEEVYSDDTTHTDNTGFTPVADANDSGLPIEFIWDLPWADFNRRFNIKKSKYIAIDSLGTAKFTVSMFVDNLFIDTTDIGETFTDSTVYTDGTGHIRLEPIVTPALSAEFIAQDAAGFGNKFGNVFGGGANTIDERIYNWPAKFKIMKTRVAGSSHNEELKIVSMSIGYTEGGIRA